MLEYAVKRLIRGRSLFLALFLSVVLAATLFSGILQGADAIGVSILNTALSSTDVDIVSTAVDKNLTKTRVYDIHEVLGSVDGVKTVDHFIRWNANFNTSLTNETLLTTIVAMPMYSPLLEGIKGVDTLAKGVIYLDAASRNSTELPEGENMTLQIDTYQPYKPPGFERKFYDFKVAKYITLDDKTFSIFMGRYTLFLRDLIIRSGEGGRRPPYQLIIMSEKTLRSIIDPLYSNEIRPTNDLSAVALVGLDRSTLINEWDISGSRERVQKVLEAVNSLGAEYLYLPKSYLGDLMSAVSSISYQMKTGTLLVAAPVFFIAWYLGLTISDVSFTLRRREVGLLLTRGLSNKQVLYIFLFEGLIVSIVSGISGVVLGSLMLKLVIPDMSFLDLLQSISLFTFLASLIFSTALATLAVYRPAKRASEMEAVDALREYREEEERLGTWQEPLMALLLGAYKFAMLITGLTAEQFRPASSNFVIYILYTTWWGVDYILSFIAPILFYWGFTKLFIQYVPWFQNFLSWVSGAISGEGVKFSTTYTHRNVKRTAASAFMAALIIGYGVTVIGGVASNNDFMERAVRMSLNADASVWLFEGDSAKEIADNIGELERVQSTAVESWFIPKSSLGEVPIRAINPEEWFETAYIPDGWIDDTELLTRLNESELSAIMERGAAEKMGIKNGGTFLIKIKHKTWTLKIVGFFGEEPGEAWRLQNPTIYVGEDFLQNVKEKYITQRRILVKLDEPIDYQEFTEKVISLSRDIDKVDITQKHIDNALNNIYLAGPRRVEELGAYFATLVATVGVVLIVYTLISSMRKELSIMAIRGYSAMQLSMTLLVESIGMNLFAIALGIIIGFISLRGEIELFNTFVTSSIHRRMVFPLLAKLNLSIISLLILISTALPILVIIRRIQEKPIWRTEE